MTIPPKTFHLTLNAGAQGFGSGEHPSTQGALLALGRLAAMPAEIGSALDIGCGSGILAMATAAYWAESHIIGTDSDKAAVETARKNIHANALEGRIKILRALGGDHKDVQSGAPYDLILCNIVASQLFTLAHQMQPLIKRGTWIILSGILAWRLNEVLDAYRHIGCSEEDVIAIADWRTVMMHLG